MSKTEQKSFRSQMWAFRRDPESLTTEEQQALGRWERLSTVRKMLAIGAFSVGTFGLGFTLGGLIFGRWRKA